VERLTDSMKATLNGPMSQNEGPRTPAVGPLSKRPELTATSNDRRLYTAATQLISTTAPSSNNSVTPTAVQAG
jgi:hypothetical protein